MRRRRNAAPVTVWGLRRNMAARMPIFRHTAVRRLGDTPIIPVRLFVSRGRRDLLWGRNSPRPIHIYIGVEARRESTVWSSSRLETARPSCDQSSGGELWRSGRLPVLRGLNACAHPLLHEAGPRPIQPEYSAGGKGCSRRSKGNGERRTSGRRSGLLAPGEKHGKAHTPSSPGLRGRVRIPS